MQASAVYMKRRGTRDGGMIQVEGAAGLEGLKELKRTHQTARRQRGQEEGERMRQKRG